MKVSYVLCEELFYVREELQWQKEMIMLPSPLVSEMIELMGKHGGKEVGLTIYVTYSCPGIGPFITLQI